MADISVPAIAALRVQLNNSKLSMTNNALHQTITGILDSLAAIGAQTNSSTSAISKIKPASGDVLGPVSSVDNEIVLFSGITGKVIKSALGTGVVHSTSGVYSASSVIETDLSLSNVATANVSITKHGFAPIAPNDATKFLNGVGSYTVPSGTGTGDVVGPSSAVNNDVALFDGITGKLIKDSGLALSGSNTGDVTLAGTPNYITIAAQVITRALINLASHVTGRLPFANFIAATTGSILVGRDAAGSGDFEEITLGTNLSMSGSTLNATGGGSGASPSFAFFMG